MGTEGDDRIFAAGGNDEVSALGGNDEVHGGTGDDFLDGGPGGFDNLFGEEGNDELTLASSDGGGVASGGDGDDVLFGSDTHFNNMQGDAGNDDLHAGAVGSSANGGTGSDRLFSGAADDQFEAGATSSATSTMRRISWCTRGPDAGAPPSQHVRRYGLWLPGRVGPFRPARQWPPVLRSDHRQRRLPDDDLVEPRNDHDLRELLRSGSLRRRERLPLRLASQSRT